MLLAAIGLAAHELFSAAANPDTATAQSMAALEAALVSLLDRVSLNVLGIRSIASPIEYYSIHDSPDLVIGVFVLKRGQQMPIHDHPNMTVFTKLVHGNLHVKTFTVLQEDTGSVRRAHVTLDKICSASPWPVASLPERDSPPSPAHSNSQRSSNVHTHSSESDTLFAIRPSDGPNLHSFTAVSDFAVIMDIMGPPYRLGERDITYYAELPVSSSPPSNPILCTYRHEDTFPPISALCNTAFQHHHPRSFEQRNQIPHDTATSPRKRTHSDTFKEDSSSAPSQKLKSLAVEPSPPDNDFMPALETSEQASLACNQSTSIQENRKNESISSSPTLETPTESSSSSARPACSPTPPVTPCICDLPMFPLSDGMVYLIVEPSIDPDCVEVAYRGLPVRQLSKLLGKAEPRSPVDRIMDIVQFAERVCRTFDRILDGLRT